MSQLELEILGRLPLAVAVWTLLRYVASEDLLSRLFEQHRGTGSERDVSFSLLVQLISDALLRHAGSGRQSFESARLAGELRASNEAVYGKLRRVQLPLSMALLRETTRRLRAVLPDVCGEEIPPALRGYQILVVDGKKLKQLPKRLKALREVRGKVLGGKVVVGLLLNAGLLVAMQASPDGEANDAPLTPGLLEQCAPEFAGPVLYVADRQFCDLKIPPRMLSSGHSFVIRYRQGMLFSAEKEAVFPDTQGRTIREAWGWLGSVKDSRRMYLRQITLVRPGEEDLRLVTNLLDAQQVPASQLLDVYLARWTIERVFQQVTEVFHLQQLVSSSPQGAIFQFALCSLFYNLIQVLRGYVARLQQQPPRSLSSEMIFRSTCDQLTACALLVPQPLLLTTAAQPRTAAAVQERLTTLLTSQWSPLWIKAPTKKKTLSTAQRAVPGGHSSAWKLIQAAKPQPPPR